MSLRMDPTTATLLDEAALYRAVYDFVRIFGYAGVENPDIYQGWQNRAALPPGSNEYAVISVLGNYRRGTNVRGFQARSDASETAEDEWAVVELVECDVQVDFCSDSDKARRRAQAVETVARDPIGVDFFRNRGVGCLYATDVRDLSFIGDATQFVRRYMTTLRLSYWTGVSIPLDAITAVDLRIENVDVHHPPK